MRQDLEELVSELIGLRERLDELTYYEVLALPRLADYIMVREAFHNRAQRFHPDRFVFLDGDSFKDAAYSVYKRMTESYNVLSDPQLRRRYDAALARGEVRLAPADRGRRLGAEERQVSNSFARIYLLSARAKLERGDLQGAGIDAELGLSLDDAAPLKNIRDEVIRRMARPDVTSGDRT